MFETCSACVACVHLEHLHCREHWASLLCQQGAEITQGLDVQISVHAAIAVHVEDPRLHTRKGSVAVSNACMSGPLSSSSWHAQGHWPPAQLHPVAREP